MNKGSYNYINLIEHCCKHNIILNNNYEDVKITMRYKY
jgi:hypothetical protein